PPPHSFPTRRSAELRRGRDRRDPSHLEGSCGRNGTQFAPCCFRGVDFHALEHSLVWICPVLRHPSAVHGTGALPPFPEDRACHTGPAPGTLGPPPPADRRV